MKQLTLRPQFVEFIPDDLEPDHIYISMKYKTALHLCCCGCGSEVVTPLNLAKWRITQRHGKVSLFPSVGNLSLPCQSHYWIRDNSVQWAEAMSPELISMVKNRDKLDAENAIPKPTWFDRSVQAYARLFDWITGLLK
jgi:hypothetical protein